MHFFPIAPDAYNRPHWINTALGSVDFIQATHAAAERGASGGIDYALLDERTGEALLWPDDPMMREDPFEAEPAEYGFSADDLARCRDGLCYEIPTTLTFF